MSKETLISNFNTVESNKTLAFAKKTYNKNYQRFLLEFS